MDEFPEAPVLTVLLASRGFHCRAIFRQIRNLSLLSIRGSNSNPLTQHGKGLNIYNYHSFVSRYSPSVCSDKMLPLVIEVQGVSQLYYPINLDTREGEAADVN
jgi:hypothetical protein